MASQRPPKPPSQGLFDFVPRRADPSPSEAPFGTERARPRETVPSEGGRASSPTEPPPRVFGVGELVRAASRTLEARFPSALVEGEVTNLSKPRSGHVYFSLTDHDGCLPSVMFKTQASRLKFDLQEGQLVRARGRLSIFEQQGKFQLYVEALEPAGMGALQIAFEQLKAKLAAEGLFDAQHKRVLPTWPRRIGIATSPTGAVIRDILRVAERRGRVRTLLAPCQVQGPLAAMEIRAALLSLQAVHDVDVIIIARGGGSAEDLAAFNDEALARTIRASRVPVVSAVGHEVDFSISDFVADLRAPTPSAAAELVVPLFAHLEARLDDVRRRLLRAGHHALDDGRLALDDQLARAGRAMSQRLVRDHRRLDGERQRLASLHPQARLHADRGRLDQLTRRLEAAMRARLVERHRALDACTPKVSRAMQARLHDRRRQFEAAAGTLSALSPLKVLERGYAIARKKTTTTGQRVLRDASEAAPGDEIEVQLARGTVTARVQSADRDPAVKKP